VIRGDGGRDAGSLLDQSRDGILHDVTTQTPFHLDGNYAPVIEEVTDFGLGVTGAIPEALDGLYVRNGPNPRTGQSPHWFLGDGMIHGVRLRGGKADWYRNRWVQTRPLNEPDAVMIGDDGSVDMTVGVANTHVVRHAGRILALVESSFPHELTADLDTVGVYDFAGKLSSAMTAHPKICPVTGEMHFFGYGFFEPYLTYHRVAADGSLVQSEVIDVAGPTMIHDFSITETQVIFMDLPVVFDLELAMRATMPYRWDDSYAARIGVMARGVANAKVQWFDVDPCYVFHPMNSFDEVGTDGHLSVVLDAARYPELWRQDSGDFDIDAVLHRWRFDLATGSVTETPLDDRSVEFPRVADHVVGLANRYGYALGSFGGDNVVVKYDLESGSSTGHNFGPDRVPGEPVFAPADQRGLTPLGRGLAGEDVGWLLTFVYDGNNDRSDLVVLDAQDVEAPPVATVALPQRVPFGFHGSWLPA